MKKLLLIVITVLMAASSASSSIIIQTQANTMGPGVGLGLSMSVIPMLLDVGIEGSTAVSPWSFSDKGSYTDGTTGQKVNYDGTVSWQGGRYGGFIKLNLFLVTPFIHAGTQQGRITLEGDLKAPGQSTGVGDLSTISGSYVNIGIPFYLGPVFTEISLGTQSLYIPHYLNIPSVTDFQIAFGLSFF